MFPTAWLPESNVIENGQGHFFPDDSISGLLRSFYTSHTHLFFVVLISVREGCRKENKNESFSKYYSDSVVCWQVLEKADNVLKGVVFLF